MFSRAFTRGTLITILSALSLLQFISCKESHDAYEENEENEGLTASEMMKHMADQLFDRWFGNSLVLNDAVELKEKISILEQGRSAGYQDLKTVLDALKAVDQNLTSPRFRWISDSRLDLAGSFRRIMRDPIEVQKNPWLTSEVLEYERRMGEEHLSRLRNSLTAQRTD